MSRRYTDEEKAEALEKLDANVGNITLTAIQTGIPVRTLHHWKRQQRIQLLMHPSSENEDVELEVDSDLEALLQQKFVAQQQQESPYSHIRQRLLEHIFDLTETLMDDPDTAHLRVSALSRLLDRALKLERIAGLEQDKLRTKRYHELVYGSKSEE
jgi:transposase-like protein